MINLFQETCNVKNKTHCIYKYHKSLVSIHGFDLFSTNNVFFNIFFTMPCTFIILSNIAMYFGSNLNIRQKNLSFRSLVSYRQIRMFAMRFGAVQSQNHKLHHESCKPHYEVWFDADGLSGLCGSIKILFLILCIFSSYINQTNLYLLNYKVNT